MADVTAAAGIYNPAGQVGYEDVKLAADAVIVPGQAVTLISTGYADDAGDDGPERHHAPGGVFSDEVADVPNDGRRE